MSHDQISYNREHISQGVADLRAAKNAMARAKEELQRDVTSILGESWEGPSHEAYQATMREWNQSMERMENISNAIEQALGNIGENYVNTQRAVQGMWSEK
ncbi:hypothetical protein GCM10027418_31110 [Mariniluteicoccus endophyticus]